MYKSSINRAVAVSRDTKRRQGSQSRRRPTIKRALRVSKPLKVKIIKSKTHAIGFALSLFCILLFKLYIRLSLLELSYQLEEVRQAVNLEDTKLREFKVLSAKHTSSKALSELAKTKLGLVETLPQQIRKL